MKRIGIIVLILVVVAGAYLYFGGAERLGIDGMLAQGGTDAPEAPQANVADNALPDAVRASEVVIADGVVVPVEYASLSMAASGIVEAILAEEGTEIEAGTPILRLQNVRQQAALEQARSALFRAQVELEELLTGARQEEITAAQAEVDAAQARLDRLTEPPRDEDVEMAEAQLSSAQAALTALYRGPQTTEEAGAKADLADAEAKLRQARSAYNEVAWSADVAKLPQSFQLEEATNAYEAAQARYDDLFAPPESDRVAAARASVVQAQVELDKLALPPTPSQLAEAEADVRRAQAQLDQLLAGAREEEIARAGADVADAKATLLQSEADLADTELIAPFDATVALLDVKVGEQVTAGEVVAQLADLSRWQIETSDLTEIDIIDVTEGDTAQLSFDAIDDLAIEGVVTRIRPVGENRQGDIVYTVIIVPEAQDERLRWNMTAVVRIGE